ncbi:MULTISPECIES: DnaJ C-terminal domain-containing protein [unclassified Exiguobacterium]|uniref:DnaJ C-terminal domain-containing protein n=1 Tax=unclassified Exiguobacterium TaxID=2644629 RepID=UPI0008B8A2DD|nr:MULTISPECIES: DnaJ C-terminal domain-containing protein [unclassified Exiguobacterium]OGX78651.1 molecular chaperone DnaJ [Exiguobacterium sp. SH31]TCI44721.1 J domain-containing protein [Exiguobacterium sp. SH5S32]TCI51128.1 J domain-containing protein [Exiguobacterium sp. SH1S4]TCI67092.1 J domain-containing protein [Exiguobacterium sp. SH0S7]TCI70102.1 J domain-containing protein [Exiguobacterium sp. SH1S1]
MTKNYYDVLGVSKQASDQDIKKAYRKLAKQYHPDVNKEPGAQDQFKAIQEAFDVLSDPDKKANYDRYGSPEGPTFGQGTYDGDGYGEGSAQFEDLFRQFGGGSRTTSRTFGFDDMFGSFFNQAVEEDLDETVRVNVPLSQLTSDSKVSLRLQTGTVNVKIPQGAHEGQKLRLKGKSSKVGQSGDRGDVYVELHFTDDETYRREGANVITVKRLRPLAFLDGTEVVVATLDGGRVKLKVKPGSRPGQRMRIPGRGFMTASKVRSDLFIQLEVDLPLDAAHRSVYEQLER